VKYPEQANNGAPRLYTKWSKSFQDTKLIACTCSQLL